MIEPFEMDFDRFTPVGVAAATEEVRGRKVVAWGVLPGERARVVPIRKRSGTLLCRVEQILKPSPERVPAREAHYLSCSPWQVMEYSAQVHRKRRILESLFPSLPLDRFVPAQTVWGYRNKLEFSFTEENGVLRLAFHERASPFRKIALPEGCRLAGEAMNSAALEVVAQLGAQGVRADSLKSLIVRGSMASGETLVALYVTEPSLAALDLPLGRNSGLAVYYSDPRSPASVATKLLFRNGAQHFTERVAGLDLACPLEGFFQNHAEVFACAVEEIRQHVPPCGVLLELYSGVGSIGLALGDRAQEIIAVESSKASVTFAEINRRRAGAGNYRPVWTRAEMCPEELLAAADVVVVDPPRSGLHPKLVDTLTRTRPARVIYLSCNPETQARDVALLGSCYRPAALFGFDFYPQTPHMESLIVLDRD